jgi:hypothetical protein
MLMSRNRLRYKIVTSFAFAALCLVALVRLAMSTPLTGPAVAAFAVAALLLAAATWRGVIYLRAARSGARP